MRTYAYLVLFSRCSIFVDLYVYMEFYIVDAYFYIFMYVCIEFLLMLTSSVDLFVCICRVLVAEVNGLRVSLVLDAVELSNVVVTDHFGGREGQDFRVAL
jgi:hypothetical protein